MTIRNTGKAVVAVGIAALLAGCVTLPAQKAAPDELPVITGSASRRNFTPLEPAFGCLADLMRARRVPVVGIAVGDVKDYTGKYSQNEGNAITQGGALMIYSALGKMGDVLQLQERFDTRIAELELAYTDRRQLGDGRTHQVEQGKPAVPWVPYFGGTILRSNYYVVGGITELNYNIGSSGAELNISGVGGKRRTYTMNIGVDLRIVDTRTLVVVRTVSLQKQIIGEEVGVGIYRFFGNELIDVNVGAKNQEPLQLGVRTTVEHGVIELISAIAGIDPLECLDASGLRARADAQANAAAQVAAANAAAAAAAAAPAPAAAPAETVATAAAGPSAAPPSADAAAVAAPQNLAMAQAVANNVVPFDFGSGALTPTATSQLEKIFNDASQGKQVIVQVLARDNEQWPPAQRRELTNQRVKTVTDYLVARGIAASRVGVTWQPAPTDTQITRHGPGYQLIATMVIAR